MNSVEIGKRIKEVRLSKKMTQSDVVGNFITRNMLSQIESGNANPSIKTLTYIANVLDIPISHLIDSYDNSISDDIYNSYIDIKELIKSGDYIKASKNIEAILDDNCHLHDELCYLLSVCYFNIANNLYSKKDYINSVDYAKKASDFSTKGLFTNSSVQTNSILLLNKIADLLK